MRFVIIDGGPVSDRDDGDTIGRDVGYIDASEFGEGPFVQCMRWLGCPHPLYIVEMDDAPPPYRQGDEPPPLEDAREYVDSWADADGVRAGIAKGGGALSQRAIDMLVAVLRAKPRHSETFASLAEQVNALRYGAARWAEGDRT